MASLAVCATRDDAELQFEKFCQFVQAAIAFMPNFRSILISCNIACSSRYHQSYILFRLEEQDLAQCSKSDVRRVSCKKNYNLYIIGRFCLSVCHEK